MLTTFLDFPASSVSSLPERIREAREAVPLTQEELAGRIDVSLRTVVRYENDESRPNKKVLRRIADATGVAADWLEKGEGERRHSVSETPAGYDTSANSLPRLRPQDEPPSPYAGLRVTGQSIVTEWRDEAGIAVALRVQLLTREEPRRLGVTTRIENDE